MIEDRHETPDEAGTMAESLLFAARDARDTRRQRDLIFGRDLLADPSWDLLLDIFIASQEGRRMSVASACLGAPVPAGTALRCIAHLTDAGLVRREADSGDPRNFYLVPTEHAVAKLVRFFTRLEQVAEKSAA
jgi:hypothetical protein